MGDFTYLPYCVVLVFLEFFIAIKLTFVWTVRRDDANIRRNRVSCHMNQSQPRWLVIFDQRSFLSCCSGLYGRWSTLLLLITRLSSALFFVVIGMGFNFARPEVQGHWQFFTNWNVGLIAGYYTLSTIATAYYVRICQVSDWPSDDGECDSSAVLLLSRVDSPRLRAIGTFLSVYFCVASVTALFVTSVNFALLDPAPRFYNMAAHLFTTISFLVEMSLNCVQLKKNEFVLNMAWLMLWLSVIWPVVYFGVKPDWPYDFLDSSTPAVFAWFQILFIVYFLLYMGWQALGERKLQKFSTKFLLMSSEWDGDAYDESYICLASEI